MKIKINKFLLNLVTISLMFVSAFISPGKGKTQMDEKGQGIILNLAADGLVIYTEWGADIDSIGKEQAVLALKEYVDQYANTQVNRLLFNVNYLRACFDSKVMTPYWDVPDPATNLSGWPKKYWKVHKKGIDVFQVCVSQSRAVGISPWLSFRMNDHHYRNNPYRLNNLMVEYPELRLSPTGSFDYARKEVRDYYKAFIKEALGRYDVDGIELDWMRTHELFKPGMESHGNGIINGFMKELRGMVDDMAEERGHAIEIAARVPATPGIGRSFGLDGVTWVKNGFVDILIPCNFWYPTNFDIPVELWKDEIGNKRSYLIAPGADLGIHCVRNSLKHMHNYIETTRAFAISAYSRGASAIYLFNHFGSGEFRKKIVDSDGGSIIVNDKMSIIKAGGKLSTITGKPRRHLLTYNDPDIPGSMRTGQPKKITKGSSCTFKIYTGPETEKGVFVVRIGLEPLKGFQDARFTVKVNNCIATEIYDLPTDSSYVYDPTASFQVVKDVSEVAARLIQFKADPKFIQNGYNDITVSNQGDDEQKIIWLEVYME